METKKEPAFPTQKGKHYGFGTDDPGMSLRDYFAAKAMQAILSDPGYCGATTDLSKASYVIADAMLEERQKPTK